jgi:hypothetical protein
VSLVQNKYNFVIIAKQRVYTKNKTVVYQVIWQVVLASYLIHKTYTPQLHICTMPAIDDLLLSASKQRADAAIRCLTMFSILLLAAGCTFALVFSVLSTYPPTRFPARFIYDNGGEGFMDSSSSNDGMRSTRDVNLLHLHVLSVKYLPIRAVRSPIINQ